MTVPIKTSLSTIIGRNALNIIHNEASNLCLCTVLFSHTEKIHEVVNFTIDIVKHLRIDTDISASVHSMLLFSLFTIVGKESISP